MPYGYFFDTSTNIAVTTDSNTFSTVFNTDYPGNQITGFQLNGVDIGSMITPDDSGLFLTATNYQYSINGNNINTTFSFTKPKPRVNVSNYASIKTYGIYTLYEFHTGSVGTFQLNTSISDIVLDLDVLLIGGGGAGGHYSGAVSEGAGGGGAGSYVTTIVKARSSFGLTINVGAGGAGTNGAESSGDPGSSSSITTSNNYSLVAGGGGSGGSVYGGNPIGTQRRGVLPSGGVYGSTGGADGAFGTNYAYGTVAGYTSNDSNTIFTNIESYVNKGGNGYVHAGGAGGGGAGGAGADNTPTNLGFTTVYRLGGNGGAGRTWSINNVTYAGGGGGGVATDWTGQDSAGGSGVGGSSAVQYPGNYGNGVANTGSGGGAGWSGNYSGNGGSGICIIAVKTSDIN
jgi:hypothetical protein